MARRSSSRSGRDAYSIARARSAPDLSVFDDEWLGYIKSPQFNWQYIDLTNYEDRRRWSPSGRNTWTKRDGPRSFIGRPRIIVVPERHRLARLQTYSGKYTIGQVLDRPRYGRAGRSWEDAVERGAHGNRVVRRNVLKTSRLGFALPWQVVICVRRKRRQQVLHALNIAGKRGLGAGKKQHRNEYSEIRC